MVAVAAPCELIVSSMGGFEVTVGSPLVFSAPHEQPQMRDGVEKIAEGGTGPLATQLAAQVAASSITTHGSQAGDPNWDDPHPFVDAALALATNGALIDLHMMANRGFEVCLGLGADHAANRPLWLPLLDELLAADLRVSINYPFGSRGRTVTARAQRVGIPAVQVEMIPEAYDATSDVFACATSALARAAQTWAATLPTQKAPYGLS